MQVPFLLLDFSGEVLNTLEQHGHGLQEVEDLPLVSRGDHGLAVAPRAVGDLGAAQHLVHRPPALDQLLLSQGVILLGADISFEKLQLLIKIGLFQIWKSRN